MSTLPIDPAAAPALTPSEAQALLEARSWTFAKTMPENPHEYTLRAAWGDDAEFARVVEFIRTAGRAEWWPAPLSGRLYAYVVLGGWKYWTMGDPVRPGDLRNPRYNTILINRKKADG